MSHQDRLTREAVEDLQRSEDSLVELALKHGDFGLPQRAVAAVQHELRILNTNPWTCRKAANDAFERELIIPFGNTGFGALLHILSDSDVVVSALRHQGEDDCH